MQLIQKRYLNHRARTIAGGLAVMVFLFLSGCTEEVDKPVRPGPPEIAGAQAAREQTGQQVFQPILPRDAQVLLEKRKNVLLIDVRTPEEIKQMRISGSLPVPVGDVIRGKLAVSPDQPVILVCAVGGRSYIAGKALMSRGYREVYNLDGGIEAWRRAGLPLEVSFK